MTSNNAANFAQVSTSNEKNTIQKTIESWSKVVAKPAKRQTETRIDYFCLPDEESAALNSSKVLKNTAGTKFQPSVAAALPQLLAGREIKLVLNDTGIAKNDIVYTTAMPLLEEHQQSLPSIWKKIHSEHIVTGGRTLRALAENSRGIVYTLKKKIYDAKEVYILNYDRGDSTSNLEDLHRRVYATIIQNIHNDSYSTYSYGYKEIISLEKKMCIHFSSEEDVYEKKEFYEIKILHENNYPDHKPTPKIAYRSAIQCMNRKSQKLLIGFYNETHVTLKLFTLQELRNIAGEGNKKVQIAENMQSYNLKQIIEYIKSNGKDMLNKTVIIEKAVDVNRLNFDVKK